MKEPVGFIMTVETAEKFFNLCLEREAITPEERMAVLHELMNQHEASAVTDYELRRTIKGKKVLHIKSKKRD